MTTLTAPSTPLFGLRGRETSRCSVWPNAFQNVRETVPARICSRDGQREEVIAIMGGAAPHAPRDLTQFSSRVDGFAFATIRDCRKMERLDRRIGQRRDATRAPTQARSGWRPSGRLLVSPLHHLRTAEILSKRWGPPQSAPVVGCRHTDGWE